MIDKFELAPIVLFTYNRLEHTKKTLNALKNNELSQHSELYIFSDGAKGVEDLKEVEAIRKYIRTLCGFKKIIIIEREKNWGLAASIIDGVTKIVNEYGKIIVLEDDLVTSPYFLKFMNDALDMYIDNHQVGMIHGHIYNIEELPDLFFSYKAGCLGWGTWVDRWNKINFDSRYLLSEIKRLKLVRKFDVNFSYKYNQMLIDQINGKNNSWAIRLYASFLLNNLFTLYPGKSLVQHIGFDKGTHCGGEILASDMDGYITEEKIELKKIEIKNSPTAIKKIEKFYDKHTIGRLKKLKILLKRAIFYV